MGGLRYHDRKRLCFFVDKGNGESFFEQLSKLNEFGFTEWVEQGNKSELYQQIGPRVLVILDNASYHKRQDIIEQIEQTLPNIQLCFLPAYSPDFNLIELVWHSCKEFIAHRLFQSVNQLKEILKRLLNDGELVINWNRKIRNKEINSLQIKCLLAYFMANFGLSSANIGMNGRSVRYNSTSW
jgi:transposase